jgi:hypothetical protein
MPGLLVALGFFAFGLANLGDYGVTWDEPETHRASRAALERGFRGQASLPPDPSGHVLPGYYFLFDLGRGATFRLFTERLGWLDWIEAQHLFHLALSSAALFLLHLTALRLTGSARAALFSALALAFLPKFVAHSQNNPKDLPALFAFVLAAWAWTRFAARKHGADAVLAGVALGVAFGARELAVGLPPVFLAWLVLEQGRGLAACWRQAGALALAAVLAFLVSWPWLWPDPVERLVGAVRHVGEFAYDRKVLYLGRVHRAGDMPWHYTLVSLAISVPASALVALALSFRTPAGAEDAFRRVRRFAWLWIAVFLGLDALAAAHYDGMRHLLVVLPALALLAGAGLESLARLVEERRRSRALVSLAPAALLAPMALACARAHPYQDAYLNELVNPFVAGRAEEVFELEYWGHAYKEGCAWLNAHAEADAEIHLPEGSPARFYLERPGKPFVLEEFADASRPRYFLTITRRAFYGKAVAQLVREYEPVFEIRRQEAVLLRIYKNDRKRTS